MTQSTRRPGFRLPWSDSSDEAAGATTTTDATAASATAGEGDPATVAAATQTSDAVAPTGETVVAEIDPTAGSTPADTEDEAAATGGEPTPDADTSDAQAADADAAAPDAAAADPPPANLAPGEAAPGDANPPSDDDFLASLVTAMRGVAAEERVTSVAELRTAVDDRIRQLEARAKERGEELRRKADHDMTAIGEWAKAEIERVDAEAARKVEARRQELEQQIADDESRSATEVEGARGRVTAYEQELEAFFAQLESIADPAAFVAAARRMPKPPALNSDAATPISTTDATPTASLNARLAELGIDRGAPETIPADATGSGEPAVTTGSEVETAPVAQKDTSTNRGRDAELAGRLAELDAQPEATSLPAAPDADAGDEIATAVMVKGLGSFGAITSFKQRLERLQPVRAVTLSLGPTGEFVYRATHRRDLDLGAAIAALEPGATVDRQPDGSLRVTVQPR